MTENKENLRVELTFSFALKVIKLSEDLEGKRKYIVAKQVLKSGTSIGQMSGKLKVQRVGQVLFIS